MNVICYGDSNTYGYDPRSYFGGRYPSEVRWVNILEQKTGWSVRNEGMNGREIPEKEVSIPENTDIFIIMLGINDLLQGRSAGEISKRMETALECLSLDKHKILLIAPPALVPGAWVTNRELIEASVQLSEQYRMLAVRTGIHFADAQAWNVSICFDGVHFTQAGHSSFADGLYKEILNIYKSKR